ncbi:hypothetical protein ACIRBX_29890 [Kitasatospora sp. NPDC096147]|uniref:hypothetical protein n=1 Tax=Kitasatospora sp. NPDC096147 TaxID=3364093 RepID=UPI0038272C57
MSDVTTEAADPPAEARPVDPSGPERRPRTLLLTTEVADPPAEAPPAEPPPVDPPGPTRRPHARALLLTTAEAGLSLAVAIGFMLWARNIRVDPLVRIGQVSGLAQLQLRAALVALPLLALVLYAAHRAAPHRYRLALRFGCAAVAGLGTGIVAGGIAVALRGTPWGLGGQDGDPATLQGYAWSLLNGEGLPDLYPPGFIVLLAGWTKYLRDDHVGFALKDLQLLLSAAFGPLCYLAWRSLLRPVWALAVALPAALFFLDPIRPYSHLVMVVLLPLLGRLLAELSRCAGRSVPSLLLRGAVLGALFGLLFLTYSGWFVWAAPGAVLAVAAVVPWRRGGGAIGRAGALLGATALTAAVVASPSLLRMLRKGASTVDRYAYFDVYVDPAYVVGWRYDRPGLADWAVWPPTGDLAGQSLFTLVLLAGLALALALGLRRPPVLAALACLISAWLLRFWFAGHMERDQAVMLYPRTTWLILYSLIALTVLAGMLLSGGAARVWHRLTDRQEARPPQRLGRRLAAGSLCGLAVFGALAGSWSANRYMPADPKLITMGVDAWRAHTLARGDGSCPLYAPGHTCAPPHGYGRPQDSKDVLIWCGNVPGERWEAVCGARAPWDQRPRD